MDGIEEPDLRCGEHGGLCEVMHGQHGRMCILEQRVKMLEDRLKELEEGDGC